MSPQPDLVEHHRAQCNRYVNGTCANVACIKRGGWKGELPVNYDVATCEAHETATNLEHLQAQVSAMREALEEADLALQQFRGIIPGNGWDAEIKQAAEAQTTIAAALTLKEQANASELYGALASACAALNRIAMIANEGSAVRLQAEAEIVACDRVLAKARGEQ